LVSARTPSAPRVGVAAVVAELLPIAENWLGCCEFRYVAGHYRLVRNERASDNADGGIRIAQATGIGRQSRFTPGGGEYAKKAINGRFGMSTRVQPSHSPRISWRQPHRVAFERRKPRMRIISLKIAPKRRDNLPPQA